MNLELTYAGVNIVRQAKTMTFETHEQILSYANPYITVTTWSLEFGGLGESLPVTGEIKLRISYPDEDGREGFAEGNARLQNIMVGPWGEVWCGTIIPLEGADRITYTDDTCPIDALMTARYRTDEAIRIECIARTMAALDEIAGNWVLVVDRFHQQRECRVDGLVDALETADAFVEHNTALPVAITCDGVEIMDYEDILTARKVMRQEEDKS